MFAELHAMNEPPDLLIFEDTPCAMASLPVLAERGWQVPDRVQVFSFTAGDIEDCCLPVSSIQPDFGAFAAVAVDVLKKVIRQPRMKPVFKAVPARFIFQGKSVEPNDKTVCKVK